MKYFRPFINQLRTVVRQAHLHRNQPSSLIKQSGIAIIFKVNKPENYFEKYRQRIESYYVRQAGLATLDCIADRELVHTLLDGFTDSDLEVLLTERASSVKDINSGFIVFPGGKCQEGQSDLAACIRQLQEQVGLRFLTKGQYTNYLNCYLGPLASNLFYRRYKGHNLYVNCHVFLLLHDKPTLVMSKSQVVESRWIKFTDMLSPQKLVRVQNRSQTIVTNAIPKLLNFMKNSIVSNINYTEYSMMNAGFQRMGMWGFSLYVWIHFMKILRKGILNQTKTTNNQIQAYITKADYYKVRFQWYYLPGYLLQGGAALWHYRNRSISTDYPNRTRRLVMGGCFLILVILLICWVYLS